MKRFRRREATNFSMCLKRRPPVTREDPMKRLILSLLLVIPTLAWASSFEALMDYCLNLPDKAERDRCVHSLTKDIAAMNQRHQEELARQQAFGMALFGSGPALIQGMNQGFRMMQQSVQPFPARPSLSCTTVGTMTTCE